MNGTYSKTLTIKGIFFSFLRHIALIVASSFACFVVAFSYAKIGIKANYVSSGSLSTTIIVGPTLQQTITDTAKSGTVSLMSSEALNKASIKHASGDSITSTEIQSGTNASYLTTSLIITVTFSSSDQTICVDTLNAIMNSTVEYCSNNYEDLFGKINVSGKAGPAIKVNDKTFAYSSLGIAIGFAIGLVISLVIDSRKDIAYFINDVDGFGSPLYKIVDRKYSISRSPAVFEESKISALSELTEDKTKYIKILAEGMDANSSAQENKKIGVVSLNDPNVQMSVVKMLIDYYTKNAQKVLLVDCCLNDSIVGTVFKVGHVQQKPYFMPTILGDKKKDLFAIVSFSSSLDIAMHEKCDFNENEVLKSQSFIDFIALSCSRYDRIIILYPPMSESQNAISGRGTLDSLLFVVAQGESNRYQCYVCLQTMIEAGLPLPSTLFYTNGKSFQRKSPSSENKNVVKNDHGINV